MKKLVIIILQLFTVSYAISGLSSWKKIEFDFKGYINSIIVDSKGTIYASTPDKGIYSSSNGGQSWTCLVDTLKYNVICLAVDNNGYIYAGLEIGFCFSKDKGRTWETNISSLISYESVYSFCFTSSGRKFAGTWDRLYEFSSDHNKWYIIQGFPAKAKTSLSYYQCGDTSLYIYCGTYCDGVYRIGPDMESIYRYRDNDAADNLNIYSMAADYKNKFLVASSDNGMERLPFLETSWESINSGLEDNIFRSLIITRNGNYIAGSRNTGVFISTNQGKTWTRQNEGLEFPCVYALAQDSSGFIYSAGIDGLYKSINPLP